MKQLELFDDLQPVQRFLHVWQEAEREHKKAASRRAVKRETAEVMRFSSACGDSSAGSPTECQGAAPRTGRSHVKPVQSPGSDRPESGPAPASWKPRSDPPQSPAPAR